MNKKGSYVVFATFLFTGMIIFIMAAIFFSGQEAISETTECFGRSWARSIIAEYDRELYNRYGIEAYYGDKKTVEDKLQDYIDYSFEDKKYINTSELSADINPYSITNLENFESEIKRALAYMRRPPHISGMERNDSIDRYINADWIISSLPSHTIDVDYKWKLTLDDRYIFTFFKDYVNTRDLPETYFQNEIEYIISGKLSDKSARRNVKTKLSVILEAQNFGYLMKCNEKKEIVLTIATILCPENPYSLYYELLATWASIETSNDIKLLYDGKQVPLLKEDENWATDAWSCLFNDYEEKYISPDRIEGKYYEEYLAILLASVPTSTKELRMMDLMQINLKFTYCDYFLMSDYYTGIYYSVNVNGRTHEFETCYEKQRW